MGLQEILEKVKPTRSHCYHLVGLLVMVVVTCGLTNKVLILTMHVSARQRTV